MNDSTLKIHGFLGYLVGSLNIYLFFALLFNFNFSLFFYFLFFVFLVFTNIILSSLTYMYIDFQKSENLNLRAKDLFLYYGSSINLTLFLLPLAYFKIYGFLTSFSTFIVFILVCFLVWFYRIIKIKKIVQVSFLNAVFTAFFPHIFFSVFFIFGLIFLGFVVYVIIK